MLAHFPHADLSSSICSWSSSLWEFSGRAPVASHSNRFLISTGFLFGPSENGIRVARGMALGKSTTGAQGLYGTATNSWTWPPSLYFPDIGAKPSHRVFLCAENQSVLGWHLGYGNRPADVDGNIRTALNITIYVIGNCVAGYGQVTSTQNLSISKSSLAEFYSSLHQQLCYQGSDGANGFSKAKSDPRRQNIRKRWVQAPDHASRTPERKTARTHPAAKALRALAWDYWNPGARKSAYALGVLRLNL